MSVKGCRTLNVAECLVMQLGGVIVHSCCFMFNGVNLQMSTPFCSPDSLHNSGKCMVEDVVGSITGLQSSHGSLVMFLIIICCDHETFNFPGLLISDLKDSLEVSKRYPNQSPLLMKQQCNSVTTLTLSLRLSVKCKEGPMRPKMCLDVKHTFTNEGECKG